MQALSEAAETLLQYLELVAADSAAADSPLTLAVIRTYARWATTLCVLCYIIDVVWEGDIEAIQR